MEKYKKYLILVIFIIFVLVGYFLFLKNKNIENKSSVNIEPTEELIPTIDDSVKISLTKTSNSHEILLSIKNIPKKTELIDYEISYQTASQGLQGIVGAITLTEDNSSVEKQLTLGTCSSGTCVYHQVLGKIKLTLKFNGFYGEKIFEKEYQL